MCSLPTFACANVRASSSAITTTPLARSVNRWNTRRGYRLATQPNDPRGRRAPPADRPGRRRTNVAAEQSHWPASPSGPHRERCASANANANANANAAAAGYYSTLSERPNQRRADERLGRLAVVSVRPSADARIWGKRAPRASRSGRLSFVHLRSRGGVRRRARIRARLFHKPRSVRAD
jgi:hypothetical protein